MKLFLLLFFFTIFSFANSGETTKALPNVLFTYDKLKKQHTKTTLQFDFNKAVSLLQQEQYEDAIKIFQKTLKPLRIPSLLNIAVAYYRLNNYKEATKYFNEVYYTEEIFYNDTYSYMSSAYYLYKISKDKKYLEDIIRAAKDKKNLTNTEKRMVADTFIVLKEYENAIKVLDTISTGVDLKKAMLYIKLGDLEKSEALLERAYQNSLNDEDLDTILWLMIYRDLKSNNLKKLQEHLAVLDTRKSGFNINKELPLRLDFNKNKYTSNQYLNSVTNYPISRQIDMAFYFAPFVFSDNQEIIYDSVKGFIFDSQQSLNSLESMMTYNAKFLEIIKKDPVIRVKELQDLIKNENNKSYVYYNLALSLVQIFDYKNAYENFLKAYNLNPGNKLYAVMTLITAKRINKTVPNKEYIEKNIASSFGLYNYFGKSLYNLFLDNTITKIEEPKEYKQTILYAAIVIFNKLKDGHKLEGDEELFVKYYKDPLVYLMKKVIKQKNESQFSYISRLQDNIPLNINNNFLEGSALIIEFYIDILKGLAIFDRANFEMTNSNAPSYLRTRAIEFLHEEKAKETIKILDNLRSEYNLEDRYILYLKVAAYLEENRYNDALLEISLVKALLNDSNADFLNGVQLIQELKINSAIQFFRFPYEDTYIDFELVGFDKFLESL